MNKIPPLFSVSRGFYEEGELAFRDNVDRLDCPYTQTSSAASHWTAGWLNAQFEHAYREHVLGTTADGQTVRTLPDGTLAI